MSRIHDALKKAEEERALLGGNGDSSEGHLLSPVVEDEAGEAEPLRSLRATTGPAPLQVDPALEAVLASCRAEAWGTDLSLANHVDPRTHTQLSEEFRSLRSRLYLMRKSQHLQKLLVTSPLPQEGKTFVAANLARAIAKQPDCRILLIDADLRIPAMHTVLGAPSTPGLSEYLGGTADLGSILQRGPDANFFLIPAGDPAVNPTELVSNGRFDALMRRLATAFEWIIIDSPPVVPVSDARLLATFCDGVMLLVNAGTTPYDLAQRACSEFSKEQLLGVILNRADQHHTYGSYYYYGDGDHHHRRAA